jgi:hypothetical protein
LTKRRFVIQFDKDNESDCTLAPRNIGYFLLDALYDSLGVAAHEECPRRGKDICPFVQLG